MTRTAAELISSGALPPPQSRWSEDEKVAHADAGTPFTITAVYDGPEQQFGGYWIVDIVTEDGPTTFHLGHNKHRDSFMASLAVALDDGPIDNWRLVNKGGNKASPFLILAPAETPGPMRAGPDHDLQKELDAAGFGTN